MSKTAYYFLGAIDDRYGKLYENIQRAGFILVFREHHSSMIAKKKGNVDTDIVFHVMEKVAEQEIFDKVILVSGDGDYIKMVRYLISKNKLEKVLAPNSRSIPSLYKKLIDNSFYAFFCIQRLQRRKYSIIKRIKTNKNGVSLGISPFGHPVS